MLSTFHKRLIVSVGSVVLVAAALSADRTNVFSTTDKAFYADQATLDFVRPGLVVKITKAEIATDGTMTAWVKITDPKGVGLDRLGVKTPGPISLSFLSTYIPADKDAYVSYITRQRTSGANTVTQATGENTGTWTELAAGEYSYKFLNKAPSTMDRTLTHTFGVYGSRNLDEFSLPRNFADNTFNFVPSGAAVTKVRDIIRTASCNKCHDQMGFHGGSRRSLELCILCHQPQTTDAATLNSVDMPVMVHKIHYGDNLPSVKAGKPYKIGNTDYSTVAFPSPAMACKACHEEKAVAGATQDTKWKTGPTRAACGACHDNVNFSTGENHAGLPQPSDGLCKTCHQPKGELDFDISVTGAHMIPLESSLLAGVVFDITAATEVGAGKKPVVTFTVKDKKGNPVDIKTMNSLRLYMGGPTSDIAGYVREDVLKAEGPGDGRYFWTFAAAIPAGAKGTWQFGIEGYRTTKVLEGTLKERTIRDYGINDVFYAGLDGGKAEPRRVVASTASCNKCHYSLEFHGGNRNTVEQCSFCHNPSLTVTENGKAVSFNLTNMVHRFHEEARYPGILRDCNQCHVGNSQTPPVKAVLAVKDGSAPYTPVPPVTNACLVCHNTPEAWSHALTNTTTLGESCTVCHGNTSEFSVNKVHAQ
ncbi:MAG TPA: OmcA/MtrC family decaheme c-type cytochrome [Paludibaculum sp.]|jgi:OmcA/MtrC family decaheme c-type cytochrome